MGFLEKDNERRGLTAECVDAAFMAASSGDWCGAWLLLESAGDSLTVLYNKALCLLRAGESETASQTALEALRLLESPADRKPLDSVALRLLHQAGQEAFPPPLGRVLAEVCPEYATVLTRWLATQAMLACGREDEARRTAQALTKYGLSVLLLLNGKI